MKYIVVLWVLFFSTYVAFAKPAKIYRCKQADGTVVIQDRRCMVTDLQQNRTTQSIKSNQTKARQSRIKPKPNRPKKTVQPSRSNKATYPAGNTSKKSNILTSNSNRSPYFTFGWDRFIPANWLLKRIETLTYEQILLSQTQYIGLNDFKQGVKLSVYPDTMKTVRVDAFAQALVLYHQIRDNSDFKLIDSQFKAHPKYKVFNIKYSNLNKQLMLTEFYIDEINNDLFVITIQSHESKWAVNWQMAEQVINHLYQ